MSHRLRRPIPGVLAALVLAACSSQPAAAPSGRPQSATSASPTAGAPATAEATGPTSVGGVGAARGGSRGAGSAEGSAFVFSAQGGTSYLLTNTHVVQGARRVQVLMPDG